MIDLVAPQKDWDEAQHPRDAHGRFTSGDGDGESGLKPVTPKPAWPTPTPGPAMNDPTFARSMNDAMVALTARPEGSNERAIVLDRYGNPIIDKLGDDTSVKFTKDELIDMTGGVIVHSHPDNMGPSPADISVAAERNCRAVVSSCGNTSWVVERTGERWPTDIEVHTWGPWADATYDTYDYIQKLEDEEHPGEVRTISKQEANDIANERTEEGRNVREHHTDTYLRMLQHNYPDIRYERVPTSSLTPAIKAMKTATDGGSLLVPLAKIGMSEQEIRAQIEKLQADLDALALPGTKDFDESKHPRDSAGRFAELDAMIAEEDQATASASSPKDTTAHAYEIMAKLPKMVHTEMPFGAALLAPDGRFFAAQTGPQEFTGKSHDELAYLLGFNGLNSAMDHGFVRTRMHESTVPGWGRQIDVEANDMAGVRRAAQGVGSEVPDTTTIYYDTQDGSGKGSVKLLASGGSESKLGSYGRFMQSIGERALRLVGWRKDDDFEAKHPRDERGRFAPDLTDRSTIKTIREHLDTHHPAWRAEATLGSSYEQGYRIAKAELLGAHHEEHLAGGNTHEHRNERGRSKDFDEDKHPRDTHGRFTDATGGDLELSGGAAGRLAKFITSDRFHHGFSYSVYSRNVPKVGKVLSIHPEREQIVEPGHPVTGDMLKAYVAKNEDLLADKEKLAGGWLDNETGRVYLDVSHIVSTDEEARRLCEQYHQEAYFDLAKGEEVRVGARLKARTLPATKGSNGRGVGRDRAQDQRVPWDPASIAGREAVERLRAQKGMRAILEDDKLWAELRDYATAAALPIFRELYLGGMEAALKLARRAGYRDFDPEKHPRDKDFDEEGTKDTPDPELQNRLAQRAALDAARLVNDWWNRLEATTRFQLEQLLGTDTTEEGGVDLGTVLDGVSGLFGPARAERIAVTETTRAMGQAATATYQELGIDGWEWRTAEDPLVCPICDDMEANNPYSIDDPFEPAHVNCRCWPVPLVEGGKEFDESLHPRDAAGRFAETEGDGDAYVAGKADLDKNWRFQWTQDVAHDPRVMAAYRDILKGKPGQPDLNRAIDDASLRERGFSEAQTIHERWSETPDSPESIMFQMAVADALGIEGAMSPIPPSYADPSKPAYDEEVMRTDQMAPVERAIAQAIYDGTQRDLKEHGVKEVTLYRGMHWFDKEEYDKTLKRVYGETPVPASWTANADTPQPEAPQWAKDAKPGDTVHLDTSSMTPLSSWSSDRTKAENFAIGSDRATKGVVIEMKVPADKIFSTHRTGLGSPSEHEFVVIAHPGDARIVSAGYPGLGAVGWAEPEKMMVKERAVIKLDDVRHNRFWLAQRGTKDFNPDQPRDDHGRWTSGGEAGGSVLTAREQANAEKYMHEHHILARTVRDRIERLLKKADPETIAKGKDWYPAARRYAEDLSKRYGVSADTIAGVIAATSPQVHWAEVEPGEKGWAASNQDQAERVLGILNGDYGKSVTISMDDAAALYAMDHASDSKERVKEALDLTNYHGIDETKWGQDFTGTHDVKDLPSDVLAAMHPEAQGLRESLTKAFEIARGKDIDQTLSGLKVRAFYNNITHPESTDVTIDGHEIHALMGTNDLPDQTYAMAINTPGKYEWFEDRVREEAARQGLSPSQLQAISWLAWRDEHPFTERRAVAVAGKDLALDEADPNDPDLWPPEKFEAMVAKDNEFRRRISAKEWDESKHPRDHGKFTFADSAGGGATDLMGGIRAVGVPGPTAEHIKNVEALFEHSVKELNIMAGPDGKQVTPEEVKASLVATAQDIITHSDVAIRIPAGLVDEVLEQGVMNQHATNSTGGLLNPEFRTNVENEAFGIPKDAKYAEFPVYGYLSNPTSERQSNVSGYGDVRLVLKDEVKDRTTYTHGDSLGAIAEDTVQPAPLRHPDALAERQDLIQYTFQPGTPRTWDDPQNYTGNYWETQIHGGVKGEDIARIEYVLNPIEYADANHSIARLNDFDQQAKMAESRGIPVYVQLNPGDMERYASERMQHYEDVVRRELSKDPTR